jgi:hypothetical protein
MPRFSHSPPETLHIHSPTWLLVRIFHLIRNALNECYFLYKKSLSLYEITDVVVIQLLNTSNKPFLTIFWQIISAQFEQYILGWSSPTSYLNIH